MCKTPAPALAEPQSYTEMQAEEEKSFCCLLPCFLSRNPPQRGAAGPTHSLTATYLPDHLKIPHLGKVAVSCSRIKTHCSTSSALLFWAGVCPSLSPQCCTLCVTVTGVKLWEPVTLHRRTEQCRPGKFIARESFFSGGMLSESTCDYVEHYHHHQRLLISTKHF